MKKHVAATLLALTTLGVLNAHIDWVAQDGGYLLRVQEKNRDVRGWAEDQLNVLLRSCASVQTHTATSPLGEQVLRQVRAYSTPQSLSARLLGLQQQSDWLLGEFAFEQLNPAVVMFKVTDGQPVLQQDGIWSGTTEPWRPGPWIRRYLAQRGPELPAQLLRCYEPTSGLFRPER